MKLGQKLESLTKTTMTGKKDKVRVKYEGYISAESVKGIGLSPTGSMSDINVWLPKKLVFEVEYADRQDKSCIFPGEKIYSFVIPRWLAEEREFNVQGVV